MDLEDFSEDDLSEEEILRALYDGELDPDLAQDLLQYYQDEPYIQERLPVLELLDKCIFPTWSQTIHSVFPLLTMCFMYKALICIYPTKRDSREEDSDHPADQTDSILWTSFVHVTGAIFGFTALHIFFDQSLLYLVVYDTLTFILLTLTCWKFKGYSGLVLSIITVIYLLVCELVLTDPVEWHKVRGSQMVLSMKVISLAFDLDSGSVATVPDVGRYLGYSFHVGSVIFGPWVSFNEYQRAASNQSLSFSWLKKIICSGVLSMVCVVVSSCLLHWLILNDTSDWLEAYRDAQSFRFSHYFVSLMSEVTVVASGVGFTVSNGRANWDFTVTRPWHIELPRSLVEVVTNWNLPMHTWLRHYVFRNVKPAGNFIAILLTYAASSLLHGLNFQLAAVLLSLGFYTYIEFVLRNKLSRIFNACVQAKQCKPDCGHLYTSSDLYVIVANTVFAGLAVFHLAYLGLMFDSSDHEETGYTMGHTLDKWSRLDYASHWFALGTFVFHLLI